MSQADRRRRFESVVVEVVEPVRRYLWRRAEPDAAEDVLSETLLVLWRRVEDIPVDAVPWSIGVARLQLANDERSRRRQHRLINRIATVDPPREIATEAGNPVDDAVRNTIAQLRPQDAEVRFRHFQGRGQQHRHCATGRRCRRRRRTASVQRRGYLSHLHPRRNDRHVRCQR